MLGVDFSSPSIEISTDGVRLRVSDIYLDIPALCSTLLPLNLGGCSTVEVFLTVFVPAHDRTDLVVELCEGFDESRLVVVDSFDVIAAANFPVVNGTVDVTDMMVTGRLRADHLAAPCVYLRAFSSNPDDGWPGASFQFEAAAR